MEAELIIYLIISLISTFDASVSAFSDLLDDTPLSPNEVSSSRLVASFSSCAVPNGKMPDRCTVDEIEKGFVTLIVSDHPGIQVIFVGICNILDKLSIFSIVICPQPSHGG